MKVAVAGLGFMGATHVKAWGVHVAAVVSSDEKKLAGELSGVGGNLGESGSTMDFSSIARYRSLDECLRDPNVEAVDLCVPTDLHEYSTIAALRAGKHVLVEKPMALNSASADRMMREAERAGRVLMCAQVLRFLPNYRAARKKLPSMGRVHSAYFRRACGTPDWSPWLADRSRSGGAVFDLLIHDIDYSLQLFGPPEWVSATGSTEGGEDWVIGRLGEKVTIEGGWYQPSSYPFRADFRIVTDGGTLVPKGGLGEGFADELAYFLECASAGRYPALCPPSDSALAVRLAEMIIESRKQNGERLRV